MSAEQSKSSEKQIFVVDEYMSGQRLDKALVELSSDLSRARIQKLLAEGCVFLNGLVCDTASHKLKIGDIVGFEIPELKEAEPEPQDIALDIVFEDDHLLVINKPVGLVVHPGAGNYDGTLVNALLHHCKGSLSGIGGVMRPGIVHRLDKETSGLIVAAKHDKTHQGLSDQLKDRSLSRKYKALVLGVPVPLKGAIDQPIGRDHRNRQRMCINQKYGKDAVTHYLVEQDYRKALSLVTCELESGRTHQIRVHMQFLKHPLIGDPLYGPQKTALEAALKKAEYDEKIIEQVHDFGRQALHAYEMSFIHPVSGEHMTFQADLADDFSKLLKIL